MLTIFGGLPGVGKTTLSAALARRDNAVYLRIDTIEQALRSSGISLHGPEGYVVAYRLACENLRLGRSVVADSVNPLTITRQAWRDVALQAGVGFLEVEIICSNQEEHRTRVESRQLDIPGLVPPSWQEVVERPYDHWDSEHIVLDTAGQSADESVSQLFAAVDKWNSRY
jgi:predicted kinase